MADDNKILLTVEVDSSDVEAKVGKAAEKTVEADTSQHGPAPRHQSARDAVQDMHKTLKRLAVIAMTQNIISVHSSKSITQSIIASTSELVKQIGNAALAAGSPTGFLAGRLAGALGNTVNELATIGKGYVAQAGRFSPAVMGAMVQRNMAELRAEMKLAARTAPSAVRALRAETALISDPDRIDAVAQLRRLAIAASRKVSETEQSVYQTIGPAMMNPGAAASQALAAIRSGLSGITDGVAAKIDKLGDAINGLVDYLKTHAPASAGAAVQGVRNAAGAAAAEVEAAAGKLGKRPEAIGGSAVIGAALLRSKLAGLLRDLGVMDHEQPLAIPREWETEWRSRLDEPGGDYSGPEKEWPRTDMILP